MATILTQEPTVSGSDLLLAELLHRINNEFASAVSIMSRAAARSDNDEVKTTLATVSDRLMAYAFVHRTLQMPSESVDIDASAFLRDLCVAISQSKLADKGIRLAFVDRPLKMNSVRCWRLGLAVCELITNAVRHAFDGTDGVIRVELLASDTSVECRISDNGRASGPVRPGRGMAIVESLVDSLGGTVAYVMSDHGSAAVLSFPKRARSRSNRQITIDVPAITLQ